MCHVQLALWPVKSVGCGGHRSTHPSTELLVTP